MNPRPGMRVTSRIIPLLAAIPLMLLAIAYASLMAMLGWNDGDPDWRGVLAGFPFVGLWFYGSLVMLLEHSHLEADASGIRITYGPLPCGAKRRDLRAEEIEKLTLDHIHVAKEGRSWRMGVQLRDGRRILLPMRHGDEQSAREQLAALQAALSAPHRPALPVGSFFERSPIKRDWGVARAVTVWGLAFLAAIAWGLAIEISRYEYRREGNYRPPSFVFDGVLAKDRPNNPHPTMSPPVRRAALFRGQPFLFGTNARYAEVDPVEARASGDVEHPRIGIAPVKVGGNFGEVDCAQVFA